MGPVPFGENFFAGFIYIHHITGLVVENYDKSLQKFEDGIILVQLLLVIRVILQELKCLCHVRE